MSVNKRRLHHVLVVLRRIKLWQLVILLALMSVASAYLLRQNNLHMIERRNLVKQADEQNDDIQKALHELQSYVTSHMNTSLGDKGIYLENSYQRAYDQAVQVAAESGSSGSATYQQADKECQGLFSRTASFPAYVQCVTDKVAASGSAADPIAAIKAPVADLYRYNFVSPAWSPDAAGFAMLITVLLLSVITFRLLLMWGIYLLLRRRWR